MYNQVNGPMGVLAELDVCTPIGEAHCGARDANGLAVWTIKIGKQEITGRWVVID
jgi:hypothetical protein